MSKDKQDSKVVPELRFREFEGGDIGNIYKKYSFTDVFLFSTGKNIKQSEASPEFKIPCIRYGELYHMYNEVIYEIINKTNLDSSELRFSKGDEILLPSAGEDPLDIGSASALTLANIAIGRTINVLRPLQENVYSQIYVSYYINEKLRRKISTLAKGSSISNVYNSDLRKLEIYLPSISEQQKIANTLTSLDNLITAESEKLATLKTHKKGLLQQLFPAKGEKVPKLRFGEFENTEGWSKYELGDFVESHKGGAPLKPKDFVPESDYEVVPKKAITSGGWLKLSKENPTYCSKDFFENYEKSVVDNSYLITTLRDLVPSGPNIGYLVKFLEKKKYLLAQGVYGLKLKNKVVTDFLIQFSNTSQYRKLVNSIMVGSTQVHIRNGDFFKLPLFVPSPQEQQKIANCLSSLDDLIAAQSEKIEALKDHKKGLMQQLFPNVTT